MRGTTYTDSFTELMGYLEYHMEQLMYGGYVKAALATVCTIFVDVFFGDIVVLSIYMLFSLADLILGMTSARVLGPLNPSGDYDARRIYFWFRKQVLHFTWVVLFGLGGYSLFRTSGATISFVNWTLFFLTTAELASVEDKLNRMGWSNNMVHTVFRGLRKRASLNFTELLNDPEMRAEIEKALGEQKVSSDESWK